MKIVARVLFDTATGKLLVRCTIHMFRIDK
jgi:hypothetical protein